MKITPRGFTLVEVMVATCLLALGTVFIYQTYFAALDAFEYCTHYVAIAPWINEKTAEAGRNLTNFNSLGNVVPQGRFMQDNKSYDWKLTCSLVEKTASAKLYKISMEVGWQEARNRAVVARDTYAFYEKK